MNKKTKAARKAGLSNNPEITVGTGVARQIRSRNAEPIVKGVCVDSAFGAKGNKNTTRKNYARITKRTEYDS